MKIKESDLTNIIISYMENKNYISYKEVSVKGVGGGIRSDSYFIKKDNDIISETIAIETKLNFTIKVIHQAYRWIQHSNKSYICVPKTKKKNKKDFLFGLKICKQLNIGVFEVDMVTHYINELYTPSINSKYKIPPLYEQQRDSLGGNDKGDFITKYKITVMNIDTYMIDKNNVELKEVIKNIDHHYKNDKSAINAITKYINKDIIKGYEIKKEKNIIFMIKI